MEKQYRCLARPPAGRINNRGGPEGAFVALWTASAVLALTALAMSLFGLAWGERVMSLQLAKQMQTYYIAEAGVEYALSCCRADREWIDGLPRVFNHDFAGGSAVITVVKEAADGEDILVRVESRAVYQAYKRTVVARVVFGPEDGIKVVGWQEKYSVFPKAGGY